MTDQIAMMLEMALVFFASRCIFAKSIQPSLYLMLGATAFLLYLLRPVDALTFLIVPVAMLVWRIDDWKKPVALIGAFIAIALLTGAGRDKLALYYTRSHGIDTSVVGSMVGRMMLLKFARLDRRLLAKRL